MAIITLISCYLTHNLFLYIFYFLLGKYYHYDSNLEKIKRLKAKGLTEQDLKNIEFVKKWNESRQGGVWKYCIRDGAIIAGAGLSLLISILFFMFSSQKILTLFSEPGDMFRFIGYSYIGGAVLGVIIYRILWLFNERRFNRLTDPLNFLFASKTISFNSPA